VYAPPGSRGWRGCDFARISAGLGFDRFLAVHPRLLGQRRGDGGHHLAAGRSRGGFTGILAGFGFDRRFVRLGKQTRACHGGLGTRLLPLGLERLEGA
jgi:hypothetical protein